MCRRRLGNLKRMPTAVRIYRNRRRQVTSASICQTQRVWLTVDTDELAPSVFAPAELADFRQTGLEDRRDRFFSYWTLKESYIKARGMGLSLPLDAFWFELGGTSPLLCVTDRCPDIPNRWRFYQHAPTDEHMMAIAVAAPQGVEPFIQPRWITPMLIAESA